MITVLTATSQKDLSTVGTIKNQLDLTDDKNDHVLTTLLRVSSSRIEAALGRGILLKQSYREEVNGYGTHKLLVSRTPLLSITQIFDGTTDAVLLNSTEFHIDDDLAGVIRRDCPFAWSSPVQQFLEPIQVAGQELPRYTVDYDAGWVFGTTSEPRTLPEDIEQGVIELTKSLFEQRKHSRDGIKREIVGDIEMEYKEISSQKLPDLVEMLIDPWRRTV